MASETLAQSIGVDLDSSHLLFSEFKAVSSSRTWRFETKLEKLLEIYCGYLGFEQGLILIGDGSAAEVMLAHPPIGGPTNGTRFPFADSFCEKVYFENFTLAINQVKGLEWERHAGHKKFGWNAYLGAPIGWGGYVTGTLAFASKNPRRRSITESEKFAVEIFADWIGFEQRQAASEKIALDQNKLVASLVGDYSLIEILNALARFAESRITDSLCAFRTFGLLEKSTSETPELTSAPSASSDFRKVIMETKTIGLLKTNLAKCGFNSYLSIPFYGKQGTLFGYIDIFLKDNRLLDPESIGRLHFISHLATLAMEYAQAQARLKETNHLNKFLENKVKERTQELEQLQKVALRSAHASGMAEIAREILHNVGNVLNSVLMSSEKIGRLVKNSNAQGLFKASEMLRENMDNPTRFFSENPKAPLLLKYFVKAGPELNERMDEVNAEFDQLTKRINAISEIVNSQQAIATGEVFVEDVDLSETLEEAIKTLETSLAAAGVTVVKKLSGACFVKAQRIKLLHILINLIKNAKESIELAEVDQRSIVCDTGFDEENRRYLSLTDSGGGVEPGNLSRIFNHGFTTKETGHGYGLHYCANAMGEMGGRIDMKSEGIGKGATFILTFANDEKIEKAKEEDKNVASS